MATFINSILLTARVGVLANSTDPSSLDPNSALSDASAGGRLNGTDVDPSLLPKAFIGHYLPSSVAAIIGASVFLVLSCVFWVQLCRMGKKYMIVLPIGTTMMCVGFIVRVYFHTESDAIGIYLIQTLLILLSPCFFLATDYVLLHHLAAHLGATVADSCLLIPLKTVVHLFVWSDVITFLIQGGGGALTTSDDHAKLGKNIVLVGLALQLVSFLLFAVLLLVFGFRVRSRFPAIWQTDSSANYGSIWDLRRTNGRSDWKVLWAVLGGNCVGIIIRSVFRILEFALPATSSLQTKEVWFYVLDTLPLVLMLLLFIFVWPSRWLDPSAQRPGSDLYSMRGSGGGGGKGGIGAAAGHNGSFLYLNGEANDSSVKFSLRGQKISQPTLMKGSSAYAV